MFRFTIPTILIVISIAGFLKFTNPIYHDISDLRAQVASYNEALGNSKELENQRDLLTKKYNGISQENLDKIKKLLPDNVDNIRLILEIEKLATPYGMALRDVKYDTLNAKDATTGTQPVGTIGATTTTDVNAGRDYGAWNLGFTTSGTYANFLSFLHDLETNLRIVDVSSIQFSSDVGTGLAPSSTSDVYQYSFVIKTYWLKN